jgi:site-specific DNA recombinase
MNKPAAIYARVSSDRQKENHTIASQTVALIEYARKNGYSVPPEWVFQDEGYSGAILVRPGLEALRDLAAEGQIAAALIYSPDRLSRKYAYQILLSEELSRCGVELIFLKAPAGATPEDQLLVQFQGMIAEYERAQIAERCRRGKKHMAQQGGVNVLSGAPYGYRYVKKSDTSAAFYEVIETEARVVRMVFEIYTQQGLSINAIARLLNERRIATRTGKGRWERSTVWGMLRNPAYRGTACYGKTEMRPRQRVTRPLRQRKALPGRDCGGHERPRAEWIEVPVPALVSEEMFALAQEQLEKNRRHSPRRTVEATLLQGMLVCEQCGYALYRASTRTSRQKLNYYRCIGSDGYRRLHGPVCTNRPIRQDYLDQFVWNEIIRLLENPDLVQGEIDRRRAAARNADPLRKREEDLRREQVRVEKSSERLVTAYQEGLVTLPQLRQRMPALQKQTQAVESELHSLKMAAVDETKYLQLAESLAGFRSKLRLRAEVLDIAARQQILRLLVKEVLVGGDTITLRHSIPIPQSGPGSSGSPAPPPGVTGSRPGPGYLLRSGSEWSPLRSSFHARIDQPVLHHPDIQECPDEFHQPLVLNPFGDLTHQFVMIDAIEKFLQIEINAPAVTSAICCCALATAC